MSKRPAPPDEGKQALIRSWADVFKAPRTDSEVPLCSSINEIVASEGASPSTSSTGFRAPNGNPQGLLPVLQDIDLLPVKMPRITYSDGHTRSLKKEWFLTYR